MQVCTFCTQFAYRLAKHLQDSPRAAVNISCESDFYALWQDQGVHMGRAEAGRLTLSTRILLIPDAGWGRGKAGGESTTIRPVFNSLYNDDLAKTAFGEKKTTFFYRTSIIWEAQTVDVRAACFSLNPAHPPTRNTFHNQETEILEKSMNECLAAQRGWRSP